ncbi:MAG: DnaD domain protein, partial [Clostridia bacterium]|nr:DnaD domain protein [Clostridia bacterium]
MSFCSFTKEFNKYSSTDVDNKFIMSYLPEASGNAVKVYLYGLLACRENDDGLTITKFSETLKLDESEVKDCFRFWEEWGLLNVISDDPFLVKYLPVSSDKPKKINVEKYGEFNKALQALIPDRMITTSEYTAYFNLMEDYSLPPEAMLMIVKYCVDIKGEAISFRYILKVATDFCQRGLNSVSKIEKELSDYSLRQGELLGIVSSVAPNKKPEIEDLNLYKKWTEEYSFSPDAILFAAKKSKAKSMRKLDKELSFLFSAKKISVEEIERAFADRNRIYDTARKIARTLSLYVEVIDPVAENYVIPWLNMGYDDETLSFIANFCFKKNKRTFEDMNDLVSGLYKNGLI